MSASPNIAEVAGLIGEPGRAAMLSALASGRALPAGELAREAGLSAPAASGHLARLVSGGLLAVEQQGRHRYYRLASEQVAQVLEALAAVAGPIPRRSGASRTAEARAMAAARTCYDHLAGEFGVALTEALTAHDYVSPGEDLRLEITASGASWLTRELGIEVKALRPGRHGLAHRCLDWTERRHHMAGPLGKALSERLFALGWVVRIPGGRALRITDKGHAGFAKLSSGTIKRVGEATVAV